MITIKYYPTKKTLLGDIAPTITHVLFGSNLLTVILTSCANCYIICVSVYCWYGCAAHQSGQVHPGDIILTVNGTDVSRMTLEEVVSTLKQAFCLADMLPLKCL